MPNTDSAGGIQVGDAVISFVADLQQLDKGIDSVGSRVEAGMSRAGAATDGFGEKLDDLGEKSDEASDEIQSSMKKADFSMSEARGSAMLLGEEIGVRMNRHVAGFVAQLPGMGEAMQTAFSALAVVALVEMLVKGSEKLADWISETFIFTAAMKDSDAAIVSLNKTLEQDAEDAAKANKALADFGKSASQLAGERVKALGTEKDALESKFAQEEAQLKIMGQDYKTYGKTIDEVGGQLQDTFHRLQAVRAEYELAAKQAAKTDTDEAKKNAEEWQKAADIRIKVSQHALDVVASNAALDQKAVTDSIKAQEAAFASLGAVIETVIPGSVAPFQKLIEVQMKAKDDAHALGVTLKSDLVESLRQAKEVLDEFTASGIHDDVALKQLKTDYDNAAKAVQNFGKDAQQTSGITVQGFRSMNDTAIDFSNAFGKGISAVIEGEKAIGPAMEEATKSFLMNLGERAIAQGTYDTAMGVAELAFGVTDSSVAEWFTAAAMMFSIGGASVAVGAAIPGGGSGSGGGSYSGTGTTGNSTSGGNSAPGPATSTTRLAAGGLITGPINAIVGDSASGGSASEAVLPLDNPEAMAKIAGAFAPHIAAMMGGGSHTFNGTFFGQLKHSDLNKLTRQINQAVNKGTATLKSTQTGRIIKRSA
jgi:hypothetical protein